MNTAMTKSALGTAVVLLFGLAACGDAADDAGGAAAGGGSVSVVLTDGLIELEPTSIDAGSVEIVAMNEGGDLHDLVIVKGDDPAALPVNEDGGVIEDDLPADDLIGRIAVIDAGAEKSASFDLDAGSYIVLCNIVVPAAVGVPNPLTSHFDRGNGMVSILTVT